MDRIVNLYFLFYELAGQTVFIAQVILLKYVRRVNNGDVLRDFLVVLFSNVFILRLKKWMELVKRSVVGLLICLWTVQDQKTLSLTLDLHQNHITRGSLFYFYQLYPSLPVRTAQTCLRLEITRAVKIYTCHLTLRFNGRPNLSTTYNFQTHSNFSNSKRLCCMRHRSKYCDSKHIYEYILNETVSHHRK